MIRAPAPSGAPALGKPRASGDDPLSAVLTEEGFK